MGTQIARPLSLQLLWVRPRCFKASWEKYSLHYVSGLPHMPEKHYPGGIPVRCPSPPSIGFFWWVHNHFLKDFCLFHFILQNYLKFYACLLFLVFTGGLFFFLVGLQWHASIGIIDQKTFECHQKNKVKNGKKKKKSILKHRVCPQHRSNMTRNEARWV